MNKTERNELNVWYPTYANKWSGNSSSLATKINSSIEHMSSATNFAEGYLIIIWSVSTSY